MAIISENDRLWLLAHRHWIAALIQLGGYMRFMLNANGFEHPADPVWLWISLGLWRRAITRLCRGKPPPASQAALPGPGEPAAGGSPFHRLSAARLSLRQAAGFAEAAVAVAAPAAQPAREALRPLLRGGRAVTGCGRRRAATRRSRGTAPACGAAGAAAACGAAQPQARPRRSLRRSRSAGHTAAAVARSSLNSDTTCLAVSAAGCVGSCSSSAVACCSSCSNTCPPEGRW